ncbi:MULTISPECIES: DUF2007 domain-containing protein [Salinivibrio]|uniref:DUF2007 domain-containing protein n=1 Tax=Salinivibrio costicola TaxID=51367 RepID=A0ABX6K0D0_SALCS|nr:MULTISPECIES: DUF2007 domain-containing protein [Salinivibrio]ODP97806.1 hypothetical protein BGK46_13190 [Salinivibrio sp. DV]OOF27118.1 hypothetical protein BZJ19_02455 [Salinivibrio proteolyticus]QIR04969.1 DUF2007 domain-containing protein [Salinivibrio costicola]
MEKVYQASNTLEAHSLKGLLASHNIPCLLKGEALSAAVGELPTDVQGVTLWVAPEHTHQARVLLQEYEAQSQTRWVCGHCGEDNAGSFELCWQCQHNRDD